ncbi:MAG: methylthioribulose 1-phosphate dehydratase [Sphingomonas sp.]|uniref:methylthioribulose 1-phosphate dehydratase n=1 Tax=Sphingomonas sp. TaxID=28214 RepID=UPI0025E182F7|nr:methylthioribulose 1-phosphate dehydratase [Sphingomonas sp.]MBY0283368.1 methylthioribulose 1-phosphate dehydratase [Sphingomonas sp.]
MTIAKSLADAAAQIIAAGRWLDTKGWAPATAGNYSMRLADGSFAITVSGWHKGRLTEDGVMRVDADGRSLDGKKPSAETALHMALYARFPAVNAVLHSHSPEAVGMSRAYAGAPAYTLAGHEMLKVLPGFTTHDAAFDLPIVDNSQDMADIIGALAPAMLAESPPPAYLIRGHGLYGWGRDMAEAERVIEGVEWMVAAELAEARFRESMR